MSRTGGARPGAGRPAGSFNKRHAALLDAAVAGGDMPVEYMLAIMRDETADPKERAWAAEKAAPYLHPRLAPLNRMVEIELPDTSTVAGIAAALDDIIQAVGRGDLAPADAQGVVALVEARRKAIETDELAERVKRLEEALPSARR